jgi:hypothetical protein
VLHVITKQLFNLFAEIKMPYDKWSIIDAATALLNMVCFNVIGGIKPSQVLNLDEKSTLDYYVIFVVLLSWIRLFSYFLVVKPISKLLMISYRIQVNTLSFNFIVLSTIAIFITLFTTFFQSTDVQSGP